jgi:hypothetical protein
VVNEHSQRIKEKNGINGFHPDSSFILRLKLIFSHDPSVARIKQVIILWPGEYSKDTLTYAIPESSSL